MSNGARMPGSLTDMEIVEILGLLTEGVDALSDDGVISNDEAGQAKAFVENLEKDIHWGRYTPN